MPKINILKISLLITVFLLAFTAKSQAATVTFSADTPLDLTGDTPALRINTGSACDSLIVTDTTVTVDVPTTSTFTLETSTYTALSLTVAGGTTTLAFDVANYGPFVTQWVASSSLSTATTSYSVGGSIGNYYKVSVDGSELGKYLADGNSVISFNYTDGYSSPKTFTVVQEDPASVGGGVGPGPVVTPPVEDEEEEEDIEEEEEETPISKPISEMTVEELMAEVSRITALIAQLQSQLAGITGEVEITGVPSDFTFENTLKFEMVLPEVKYLQIVLNSDPQTKLASSGVGSPGHETNIFGPLTKAAVIKFQEKYTSEVLAPWELTQGTGLVGETTRAKLNQLLGR